MLQTSQTGTNSKPYLGCSPHLKVIEAPPQKDLKLVLCYVGICMQKVGKHLGVSIPSPSCLHSIDNHFPLAKSQRNFIHSHKSGHSPWELKRSPDFLLTCRWDWCDMSSRIQLWHKSKKIEKSSNHAKKSKKYQDRHLWLGIVCWFFWPFQEGTWDFHCENFMDQSLPSFGGLGSTPNAPWCSGLRFRCKDQRMDATNEKYLELRSFKRHYRTNTQTHIINKQSEVPCGTQKCDSSVFEWHQYLPSFKIVNGYRNRRMILVCHRKFSPKSSHLIFPTKPPGRGRIH